ncbi:MAG: wax ester/triacylglycerol synthase domain-containing protein, partial [Actinomycetes bacterium]
MTTTRMSDADAAWLGMDSPDNLMMVTGVLRFDEQLSWPTFADVVRSRMVDRYPTFRRRALPSSSPFEQPVWTDDPDFDLDRHLVASELPAHRTGDGEAALAALVSDLLGTPLDMTRSPWQFHLVDGPGHGSTVVARLHHCIADGIALAAVLLSLTDTVPPAGCPTGPVGQVHARRPGLVQRVNDGAGDVADVTRREIGADTRPVRRARVSLRFGVSVVATGVRILCAARDPRTRLSGRLGARKVAAWTRPLDLDSVKKVARGLDVTVNDVLLAATAGALRRHLVEHGDRPHDLRIFVPVNLRPAGEQVPRSLGNRFGLVFVRLPLSVADPVARVREVHERMSRVKGSAQAAATFAILTIVGALPSWGHRLAVRLLGAKSSAIVTNVPGPREPVLLAGSPLARVV